MKEINQTQLKNLILTILSCKSPDLIRSLGSLFHPTISESNYDFHKKRIYDLIDKVKIFSGKKIDYIISRISFDKENNLNIDIHITKQNDKIQFYFIGNDLAK
jgi:hypothetical protein